MPKLMEKHKGKEVILFKKAFLAFSLDLQSTLSNYKSCAIASASSQPGLGFRGLQLGCT